MRSPSATIVFAFALPFTGTAVAQTTRVVGSGGFPTINAALAACAPGDVLVVQPGSHAGFQAAIGVTIRAATRGTVAVASSSAVLPANQVLHLVDLAQEALFVNGGTCSIDRCQLTPLSTQGASLNVTNAQVHLQQCTVGTAGAPYIGLGSMAGLAAYGSVVTAVDSSFRGRNRDSSFGVPGGPGIDLHNSTFHGSRLLAQGGDGVSNTSAVPGNAVRASGSVVWIVDSNLSGGSATNLAGAPPWQCPVVATAGSLARCTLVPAACTLGIPADAGLLGVHRVAPPLAGAPLQVEFQTVPNGYVAVFASFGLGHRTLVELAQPVSLELSMLLPLAVLVADGTGFATGSWPLPPGSANLAVWLQGIAPGAPPLQLSAVVGGVVR